ncbi:DNA-binding response regulator, OmpR family, contains REC and winged-helix (wHTH) domain [Mucilaginibacter pineti]|uniref:DNA-binding response regulator, OmpR family, contains REC and winged-helix (WHTH) domain n=1 Tax=Mucilaginibacter pineti TaxID=1391627 RepID=A0A1G7LD45_9SPHI|nr:response regulator transcription factor [Mucilaginibacter pineti]SDF46889.1 DNA-binding response regulator, OmpR family, contains REC and winged-helix (wHTH) domain [Mucilaginibacter pineti]
MEKVHILLVEDEPFLAKVIKDSLEQRNFQVTYAEDGAKGYNLFQNGAFALCIVDVMLPHTDGFTLVKQIRVYDDQVPVLFLTAKTATEDVIEGYNSGGNDYLKKPFSLEELFLRVNELLKRTTVMNNADQNKLMIGNYTFLPHQQLLQIELLGIKLSHREASLLLLLYNNRNSLLERKSALMTLWGDDSFYNTRTMDVFITKLRKHLSRDAQVEILNIRGVGYKLIC